MVFMIHCHNFLTKWYPVLEESKAEKDTQFWSSDSKKIGLVGWHIPDPVYPILESASHPGSGTEPTGNTKHV